MMVSFVKPVMAGATGLALITVMLLICKEFGTDAGVAVGR